MYNRGKVTVRHYKYKYFYYLELVTSCNLKWHFHYSSLAAVKR